MNSGVEKAVEELAKLLYAETGNEWAWEDNEACRGIYTAKAERYLAAIQPFLVQPDESAAVAVLRRVIAGETKTSRIGKHGCEVIYGSRPDGHTCLDERRLAEDPNERYSDDYREKILRPDYPCICCQARLALAASPQPENSGGVEEGECEECSDTGIYREGAEWTPCQCCQRGKDFAECLRIAIAERAQPQLSDEDRERVERVANEVENGHVMPPEVRKKDADLLRKLASR